MAKSSKKSAAKKSQPYRSKILETMTAPDALTILQRIAEEDAEMAQRFEAVALEILSGIDIDDVASEVRMELESLNVEDVWGRSGAMSDGYVDPGDAAWQMFEDALEPFQEQLDRYKQLSMNQEAKLLCMGILNGIYEFHKESSTEYKEWAIDAPGEYFSLVLQDWREWTQKRNERAEMDEFLAKTCPEWAPTSRKRR
jgi:hypothetical protein